MRVLGVDPGYRNLGLAILEIEGSEVRLIHSRCMAVGRVTAPLAFTKFLWPALNELDQEFGPIDGIASETPPFIMGQIKTTAFLWAVSSIIVAWSHAKGLAFRHASPLSLKRAVCKILGVEWDRKYIPKKRDVKQAVKKLLAESGGTSHEDDAILAGLLMFTDKVPE